MTKQAEPDHPVHDLIAQRWSPYAFDPARDVDPDVVRALFEAARWAASSFNEQPWRYIVATRDDLETYDRVLACLVEMNQNWARYAPVLALGIVKHDLTHNGKPNRAAVHDLGAASASLTFEATARGLFVHQMIGIEPDKAREAFAIPAGFEAWTGLAIGYIGEPDELPDKFRERDTKPRARMSLPDFVFGARFGEASSLT